MWSQIKRNVAILDSAYLKKIAKKYYFCSCLGLSRQACGGASRHLKWLLDGAVNLLTKKI